MAFYDIWIGQIRLWRASPKRERLWCRASCHDGSPCQATPVWDKRQNRPVNGCCRMHSGLSSAPKTEEGRQHTVESNCARTSRPNERGKREAVTQRGIVW